MRQQLDIINLWYHGLPTRDRRLLLATVSMLIITLFYLVVWEPMHQSYALERNKLQAQHTIHAWMQSASSEAIELKRSGARNVPTNQPITLVLENSAKVSGLKPYINKIESSGKNGARVKIDSTSFDQLLVWLNTLEQQHGVTITTANIERHEKSGAVSARLSFEKLQ